MSWLPASHSQESGVPKNDRIRGLQQPRIGGDLQQDKRRDAQRQRREPAEIELLLDAIIRQLRLGQRVHSVVAWCEEDRAVLHIPNTPF